jgi:adenosine deaminase
MPSTDREAWLRALPKAELHLHLEGTLEPELMLALAERNRLALPYPDVEAARRAYRFTDLQSFLDLYYTGAGVLRTEQDFHDLAWAYLARARAEGVRHAELFLDPQTHLSRGVAAEVFVPGLVQACRRAERALGLTWRLIPCFLRHRSQAEALATFETLRPHFQHFTAFGLDSSELGHPPGKFTEVFARVRSAGFRAVAHAGEEGPPEYVRDALDLLRVERIDHGVRAEEDPALLARLRRARVPLTVCPLSNVALRVVDDLRHHNLKRLLEAGLVVTVNSDDPAYFGGSLLDNYRACRDALGLTAADLARLAEHSFEASFLPEAERRGWREAVRAHLRAAPGEGT